jgi:hypothetical protein
LLGNNASLLFANTPKPGDGATPMRYPKEVVTTLVI